MHRDEYELDLMRDKSPRFPEIPRPSTYASARIWHCSYESLEPLASFVNLEALAVATYPDATLNPVAGPLRLEWLMIIHMPRVTDLAALRKLTRLKALSLATLPSWDVSGKVTEVNSLAPLAELPQLETLELFGVRPPDRSVGDLLRSPSLREARISKYPKREIARLQDELARRAAAGM
jgi:hypothetical protein